MLESAALPTSERISQSEYARRRGVATSAVVRAVKAGRIKLVDGKIDPKRADRDWRENTRARGDSAKPAASRKTNADEPDYATSRARREAAEAEKAELATAQLAGRLVERERVERAAFGAARATRDRVVAAVRRGSIAVVGVTDVREVELALMAEMRIALDLDIDPDCNGTVARIVE